MKTKNIGAVLALMTASLLPAAEPSVPPVAQNILGIFHDLREAVDAVRVERRGPALKTVNLVALG
ncbi:MAG TPA: hypothetical protein VMQ56_06345 [Terracidiphilus sp.]|nr:hypothetical protein [Terracidiphilus sp.]